MHSLIFGWDTAADGVLQLYAVNAQIVSATKATNPHLAPDAEHGKAPVAAGMRFFQLQRVSDAQTQNIRHNDPPDTTIIYIIPYFCPSVNAESKIFSIFRAVAGRLYFLPKKMRENLDK